jgi:curved DNA-binding protein CbpA
MKVDPYQILGLNRSATLAQVKQRYYQLARQYHPDVRSHQSRPNVGNLQKFNLITKAFKKIEKHLKNQANYVEPASYKQLRSPQKQIIAPRQQIFRSARDFNLHRFNQYFEQSRHIDDQLNYFIPVGSTNRDKDISQRQLDTIYIPRVFDQRSFSNQSFNQLFESVNQTKKQSQALEVYDQPQEAPVSGTQAFVQIDKEGHIIDQTPALDQVFNLSNNPNLLEKSSS